MKLDYFYTLKHCRMARVKLSCITGCPGLNFLDQICPKKVYFWSKTEKVNITNELSLFELVKVTTFSLKWQF